MSGMTWEETGRLARKAAVRACWTQWVGMGSLASPVGSGQARSIIDPEALILLSLHAKGEERRLEALVAWWARVGSRLTSLQRLRAVAKRFPGGSGDAGLQLFASLAADAGDRRWKKEGQVPIPEWIRNGKGPDEPALIEASALWLRLRAGFGVGAKADTLAFLLGLRGACASANVISRATGYSSVAIRRAAGEMALARLIRKTEGRPVEYMAPARPWIELLDLDPTHQAGAGEADVPAWRFWSEIFAFLAAVMNWSHHAQSVNEPRRHVVASNARDIVERHQRAFGLNGIPTPPMDAFRGLDGSRGLHETVRVVADWMEEAI